MEEREKSVLGHSSVQIAATIGTLPGALTSTLSDVLAADPAAVSTPRPPSPSPDGGEKTITAATAAIKTAVPVPAKIRRFVVAVKFEKPIINKPRPDHLMAAACVHSHLRYPAKLRNRRKSPKGHGYSPFQAPACRLVWGPADRP
jgi:hypothetical protein